MLTKVPPFVLNFYLFLVFTVQLPLFSTGHKVPLRGTGRCILTKTERVDVFRVLSEFNVRIETKEESTSDFLGSLKFLR